ncbi:MAG: hypothetical protein FWD98_03165 [Defluviitaleaceae bacterium]|nr:hypothetical protein [Defluviitaleaceae bacterium]
MFFKQLVNFVIIKLDNGQEIMMKYMLTHRNADVFGVLAEKHVISNGEMHFEEQCESTGGYSLRDALVLAESCTTGKVLPTTYPEIEEEIRSEKMLNVV